MIENISVAILTKNNENTIKKTLQSLTGFKDVVVYDNGSTDATMTIVKEFKNVNLVEGEFRGFGWTKNEASSFTKCDWVLTIDSDETLSDKLFQTLLKKQLDKNTVYQLISNGFYKDIAVKHSGWSNLKVKRLYNKQVTLYNSNDVHEEIISNNYNVELLDGYINHYSYHSISEFIIKADYYSTLFAKNNVGKKSSSPTKAILNSIYSFVKTYFFKRGFLDGYVGLIISFSHMVTNFYKYIKLYELNKELKD